jgi:glucuronate isomerase
MYRRILAETLAEDLIRQRGWTAGRALELAHAVLLDNPRRLFSRSDGRERFSADA